MEALGLAEPVAVTLVRRGHRTVDEARAFLEAAEAHDPFEFGSMEEVTERIRSAIADGRTITVHGDYDCDGVCSTAILVRALRELGASCDWYIPDRLGDGYGLTDRRGGAAGRPRHRPAADGRLRDHLRRRGGGCPGRRDGGDRHRPPRAGRAASGLPHPSPPSVGYPFAELCATGVAYKLSAALLGAERAADDLDLVALATVADLVPLRGENRALVRAGLRVARQAAPAGAAGPVRGGRSRARAPRRGRRRLPPRPADQRRRPPLPRRRRGRADAHRRRGDGPTAIAAELDARQPRAPRHRAARAERRRAGPRRAAGRARLRRRRWCSPGRAGIRAWSGSSPRAWPSATSCRSS